MSPFLPVSCQPACLQRGNYCCHSIISFSCILPEVFCSIFSSLSHLDSILCAHNQGLLHFYISRAAFVAETSLLSDYVSFPICFAIRWNHDWFWLGTVRISDLPHSGVRVVRACSSAMELPELGIRGWHLYQPESLTEAVDQRVPYAPACPTRPNLCWMCHYSKE